MAYGYRVFTIVDEMLGSVAISSTAALVIDVKHLYFSRGHFKWESDPDHYYQPLLLSPSGEGVEALILPWGEN